MLGKSGFDLWAGDYDKSVGIADDNGLYPFAGYKSLMNAVYGAVMAKAPASVLDIGIGTGTLAAKLCLAGNRITGLDFSGEMIKIAQGRMPEARLIECDFSLGMPEALGGEMFDLIISTYALHHLTDERKQSLILSLLDYLCEGGAVIIGDVSFPTRGDLERCKADCGDEWDADEFYFVADEICPALAGKCEVEYHRFSHCSGVLEIRPVR